MPRTLPWTIHRESTRIASPRRSVDSPKPAKRARVSEIELESDKDATPASSKKQKARVYTEAENAPSSPPPEQPPEVFMREGIEQDDKYRMVEDEFLSTAQQFTLHLHAAEYKRQEKIARARNAETISSISRPVTQAMSGHTKRKVEGIEKSKAQQDAIQTILGQNPNDTEDPDDSSNGEGLAYFNTTLRGLMDSPRRKVASLSKVSCGIATRAAAGFQKRAAYRNQNPSPAAESPMSKPARLPEPPREQIQESSTESSDFDDDLDAPVPAARNTSRRRIFSTSSASSSPLPQTTQSKSPTADKMVPSHIPSSERKREPKFNGFSSQSSSASPDDAAFRGRRTFEQSRLLRPKIKKDEDEDKKNLNLIPTFL